MGFRAQLEDKHTNLIDALTRSAVRTERSERLIESLESRFLSYLQRLNISFSDLPLTASINRTTYSRRSAIVRLTNSLVRA